MAQHHLLRDLPVEPVRLGRAPTYADVEALEEPLRGEIVDGQLYALPRPWSRHHHAQLSLGAELRDPFQRGRGGPGGWRFLIEDELHLGSDVLVPDVAGWRRERLPDLPAGKERVGVAPDWVCEVLSDSTHAYDRGPKMATYGRHGVRYAWIVDPDGRSLEAYRNDKGVWRPLGSWQGNARVRVAPFDALELELELLWE